MPYSAEINRAKPTAFFFLIDQSGSMDDAWGLDGTKRKCDAVADAINRLLSTLVIRCAKGEDVRDYFQVGVLGYGANGSPDGSIPPNTPFVLDVELLSVR